MREFTFKLHTKIYFGTNITEKALMQEEYLLNGNVMIVTTGRSLIRYGYLDHLKKLLNHLKKTDKIIIYDKISQNPRLKEVQDAVEVGKGKQVQIVIGFGGGSALDAAKAVAVGIPVDDDLEEYLLDGKEPSDQTLPVIAIPTTAGTGSELSKGAILSSPEYKIKTGIRGKNILPKVAIVDPVYTWTVPRKVTMETGFDVLAHAVESYVGVKANCFSEMLSEKAIRTVAENLPILYDNPDNHEAREQMCFASMLMGMNLATVGTCFPHRMQYAIGAVTDTSHAAGLAALYPAWIQQEYKVNEKKIKQILTWMGYQKPDDWVTFMKRIGIPYSLTDLGITENMLEELVQHVTGNLVNDKLAEEKNMIEHIFRESL